MAAQSRTITLNPVPEPQIRIADSVVAKIAAHYTLAVPGVVALRSGITDAVVNIAGRVARPSRPARATGDLPSDGVTVAVDDANRIATITVDVVLRLGVPCLEVAKHVQQQVDADIRATTGLTSSITVNIVDVTDQDDNENDAPWAASEQTRVEDC